MNLPFKNVYFLKELKRMYWKKQKRAKKAENGEKFQRH